MKVVVIDPSVAVRSRLVAHLRDAGVDVAGDAGSVSDACPLIKALQPQVIIADILDGDSRSANIVTKLRECAPGTRLIILTNETHFKSPCLARGADAFLDKSTQLGELVQLLAR